MSIMNTLRQIIRRENLVAFVLIIISLLGYLDLPQQLGIKTEQLILLMLGFLAVDALIEKIGYLEQIDNQTKDVAAIIRPHPDMVLLESRDKLPTFPERIRNAKEVFVFAISAHTLVMQYSSDIKQAMKRGTHFQFVLTSPDNPALGVLSFSVPTSADLETHSHWIRETIRLLSQMAQEDGRGKLELRLFNDLPTTSIIGYDIKSEAGKIQVEPHIFRRTPSNRPLFVLRKDSKNKWFEYYERLTRDIWNTASVVSFESSSVSNGR